MASTVVSFEMAVIATDVASFDASPEKVTLEASLKNELSCLEPACFLELRATEAAGRRRLASTSGINVEVILTIPDTAPDGSKATAAAVTSTVEAAATTLVSAPAAQLASRLGVEVTPDVSSVATAANINVALGCGVIGEDNHIYPATVTLGTYPGYTGALNVQGVFTLRSAYRSAELLVYGVLAGLPSGSSAGWHSRWMPAPCARCRTLPFPSARASCVRRCGCYKLGRI